MPRNPSRALMGSLLLLFVLVWFGNLEYRTLIRPDEGRYAEIPREMVATGDWITPRLNGLKYFEKPVLQYWATAAAYTLFGEHNWTARLWPALTGFAGVFLVWLAGRRLWNENAGRYTALVAGSSLLYVFIGHVNTLDMGLTFFMSLSLCGFLLAQRDDATPQENRFWMYAAWAGAAGAMLSKGLIALVLPGAVLVLYILLQRDWGMLKRLHLVSGTLLFLALAAPWFVAVSLKNPEFFNFFFIHEHFNRFLTKVHARYQPWWYFVPILLAGILPWLFHLGETLLGAWRNEPSKKFQPRRFLLIWAVFIFLFFSRSDSKLPSYILPIFPALALLMGERFSRIGGRRLLWLTAPLLPLALAAMLLAPRAVSMADADAPLALYQNYVPWLVAAGAVFAVGVIAAMVLSRREAIGPALASIAFSGLLASQLVLTGHEELAPAHSSYLLAEKVKPYLKPDTPFYSVYFYEQTLPFLIKRPVTVVEFLDELEFGIRQEPDKWLALERDFLEVWKTLPYGLAIMKLETYAKFVEWKVPMVLIAKDNRAAIVRTP